MSLKQNPAPGMTVLTRKTQAKCFTNLKATSRLPTNKGATVKMPLTSGEKKRR